MGREHLIECYIMEEATGGWRTFQNSKYNRSIIKFKRMTEGGHLGCTGLRKIA